jgi:hypothetical protein
VTGVRLGIGAVWGNIADRGFGGRKEPEPGGKHGYGRSDKQPLANGRRVALVSSAQAVAEKIRDILNSSGETNCKGSVELYTSDSVEKFEMLCEKILGEPVKSKVYKLDIEKYESGLLNGK